METSEIQARMWADLFTSEMNARALSFSVTERAVLYVEAGLPVESVLDALKISRATWYRRVSDHNARRADNRVAASTITVERQAVEVVRRAIEDA